MIIDDSKGMNTEVERLNIEKPNALAGEHRIEIRIAPRAGLLDPEGKAIQHALESLEFDGVGDVRVGRLLRLTLRADSPEAAREEAEAMCRKLLANPVTEDYEIEVLPGRDETR